MKKMKPLPFAMKILLLSSLAPLSTAHAENWANRVSITGFASTIYHRTNEAAYFDGEPNEAGIDDHGSFQGTRLGINLAAKVNDRISIVSQLIGTASDDYNVHVDWAFAAINLFEPLTLRVGKVKYPVGIVNEYRDVGYAYPWIDAPASIYTLYTPNGPQAIRESFTGGSLLYNVNVGSMTYSLDVFGGEVNLETVDVRELRGATAKIDWDDKVLFQISKYNGTMFNATAVTAMNGQGHEATVAGLKVDWNNYVVYAEAADVKMGSLTAMKAKSNYITAGYRFGKWLPHITTQNFEQGQIVDDQTINKIGLRYDIWTDTALKFEVGKIKTDKGQGLFDSTPSKNSVNIYGVAIDVIF